MKSFTLIIVLILQSQLGFSQSTEAIEQSNQKEKLYYKKKMIPKGENYVNIAPQTHSLSIIIDVPVSELWDIIDNTPGFKDWFPDMKSGRMIIESEKGIKAKRIAHAKNFKYYEEIIAYRENEAWGFTIIEANSGACNSIVEVIYLESIDEQATKVTYKGGYEYRGAYNLMKGIANKQIIKTWTKALKGLKIYAEK